MVTLDFFEIKKGGAVPLSLSGAVVGLGARRRDQLRSPPRQALAAHHSPATATSMMPLQSDSFVMPLWSVSFVMPMWSVSLVMPLRSDNFVMPLRSDSFVRGSKVPD